MARDVMRHRLVLSFEALSDNVTSDNMLTTILRRIPLPAAPTRERSNVHRQRLSASSSASTGRSSAGSTGSSRATTGACSTATASTWRTCASTSPATTSGTSTGTSPRGWTVRTSASTPRTARSTPGSCWTSARRWTSGRPRTDRQKRTVLVDFVTTLARLLTRRGNRVGAVFYGSRVEHTVPARGGRVQVLRLVNDLLRQPRLAGAPLDRPGARCSTPGRQAIKRRSLVFVISDFISVPGWERSLDLLNRRHEVVAVRLVDPREVELPDVGPLILEDAETGEQLYVDTRDRGFRDRFAGSRDGPRDGDRQAPSSEPASTPSPSRPTRTWFGRSCAWRRLRRRRRR